MNMKVHNNTILNLLKFHKFIKLLFIKLFKYSEEKLDILYFYLVIVNINFN